MGCCIRCSRLIGDYDNGSASGNGRSEYIWLPTTDGAIPVGLFRNGRFFAIHSDHVGTPRLMTSDVNKPVWQWPYSAFGTTKPTGVLKATDKPKNAMTNQPVLLEGTGTAQQLNLRDPGQYEDAETGLRDNINRMLSANTGRYTQYDPIGQAGGPNGYLYADANPLSITDPWGLMGQGSGAGGGTSAWGKGGPSSSEGMCKNPCADAITINYTINGVCNAGDVTCVQAMRAAGLQGPYHSMTGTLSASKSCVLKLGVGLGGAKFALGTYLVEKTPKVLAQYGPRVGLSAAAATSAGGAIALLNSGPAITISLTAAAYGVYKECECKK